MFIFISHVFNQIQTIILILGLLHVMVVELLLNLVPFLILLPMVLLNFDYINHLYREG